MRLACQPRDSRLFIAATTVWALASAVYGFEASAAPVSTSGAAKHDSSGSVRVIPRRFFDALLSELSHDVDVQYKISLKGNTSGDVPAIVANVWATYTFTPEISASIGLRHVSRAYANTATSLRWSGYSYDASLDLTLTWQINPRLRMIGRLRSAGDVNAIHVGPLNARIGVPKAPNVTLEYRF